MSPWPGGWAKGLRAGGQEAAEGWANTPGGVGSHAALLMATCWGSCCTEHPGDKRAQVHLLLLTPGRARRRGPWWAGHELTSWLLVAH